MKKLPIRASMTTTQFGPPSSSRSSCNSNRSSKNLPFETRGFPACVVSAVRSGQIRGTALIRASLHAMMDRLIHRGPDDAGDYRDNHAALGFRRLSIIDLAGGHQPLVQRRRHGLDGVQRGDLQLPRLRRRLEAKGHDLRSSGDTEVLVHLYEDEGTRMFSLLRGMFALAIWDAPRQNIGPRPRPAGPEATDLSPRRRGIILRQRARRPCWPCPRRAVLRGLIRSALDHYLSYGYVPHPRTILEGTHKLPPAHYRRLARWGTRDRAYWKPDWNVERDRPIDEDVEELRATLGDAVREQMIADVPLGHSFPGASTRRSSSA